MKPLGLARVRVAVALLVVAVTSPTTAPATAAPGFTPGPACREVVVPVGLRDGQPTTERVYGELCLPHGSTPRTVAFLNHGAGYNHAYWSWPQDSDRYSYVRRAVDAGYATLAIDRLGVGRSTRPHSGKVTYQTTISVLHQVIQALRSGSLGPRFARVEYVGHSYGSMYGLGVAATYPGVVDALLLTGSGQKLSPAFAAMAAAAFVPAVTVAARFAGLDPGWLAARPGTVGPMHYYQPTADPTVIAFDEAHQEPVSQAEFATRPPDLAPLMAAISVPVLIINGANDIHYCAPDAVDCTRPGAMHRALAPHFSPRACLRTSVVALAGHNLPTHQTAPLSAAVMLAWSQRVVPPHGTAAECRGLAVDQPGGDR